MASENKSGPFFNDGREAALHDYVFSLPLDRLHNNPAAILSAIDTFVVSKTRMMVFQKDKIKAVRNLLASLPEKPKVIVELGTYVGNSAVAFGSILKDIHDQGAMDECKIITLELSSDFVKIARDFVGLAGLDALVHVVQGPAAESLKNLHQEGKLDQIDVLFVDHFEEFYLSDLLVCEDLNLLKKGTVVIADNTDIPEAPDYLKYVKSGGSRVSGKVRYDSQTYETTDQKGVPNVLEVSTVVDAP